MFLVKREIFVRYMYGIHIHTAYMVHLSQKYTLKRECAQGILDVFNTGKNTKY